MPSAKKKMQNVYKLKLFRWNEMIWCLTFKLWRLFACASSAILPSVSPCAPQITRILTCSLFSIHFGNLSCKNVCNPMAFVLAKLVTIVCLFSKRLGVLALDEAMILTTSVVEISNLCVMIKLQQEAAHNRTWMFIVFVLHNSICVDDMMITCFKARREHTALLVCF